MAKTIILFGGSFDPIHIGHVEVARASLEKLNAEKVIFIPAKRSPHKYDDPGASAQDRIEMVTLAIENEKVFRVSPCEVTRAEPSYTLDTLKLFRQEYPADTDICFLIGADTITDLHKWYKVEELMSLCRFCTMYRGGLNRPDFSILKGVFSSERIDQLQNDIIETPLYDISSTEIRKRLAQGQSADEFLNPKVAQYIKINNLYQNPAVK